MWLKTIWINLTSPTLLLEYNGNIAIYPSLKISGEKQKICVLSLKKYLKEMMEVFAQSLVRAFTLKLHFVIAYLWKIRLRFNYLL